MLQIIGEYISGSPIDRKVWALACGYMDAKHMVFMKETYGLPLEIYVDMFRKKFEKKIKIDYAGLKHELLMIGTNEHGVDSILSELKLVDKEWTTNGSRRWRRKDPMRRILRILMLAMLALSGCAGPFYAPPPAPNVVDLTPNDWGITWSSAMPDHPSPLNNGWSFDVPNGTGHVNYVVVPFQATLPLEGKTISMTFRVVSTNPAYSAEVEAGESNPASLHLFFQRAGDDWSGDGPMQYYRWWCGSDGYLLGSQDNQTITLSCTLANTGWMSVRGGSDPTDFKAALDNIAYVGFTLGGIGGWGHGVRLTSGTAQFQLIGYQIQ